MPDYNTMRTLNGAGSLVVGIIILYIGATLLWRGYAERAQWVRQMPGRMVIGSFLTLTALIQIEAAIAKLLFRSSEPGGVGRYINTWYINTAIAVCIWLGVWSMWRLRENTLGPHQDTQDR